MYSCNFENLNMLSLYNSLSRTEEIFTPHDSQLVKMYVCGPTVYDRPHLGNARSIVVYDVLFRLLQHLYGEKHVLYVRNITDVDDKINHRANELGIDLRTLTTSVIEIFNQDVEYLGCKRPSIEPRATDNIETIIKIIRKLIESGHAYQNGGTVLFKVRSFPDYYKLSGRIKDDLLLGTREIVEVDKHSPEDFILWKPADSNTPASAIFDSPFGKGRPGWHIECSAMSYRYLGENFDIHGGGADLMFPHHTNEIAQSCSAFPGSSFAKYWIHNGFLTNRGEKMSKSLGNIVNLDFFTKSNVPGEVVRMMLLMSHYRKPMDFNQKLLEDATKLVDYIKVAFMRASSSGVRATNALARSDKFVDILSADLNTPLALGYLHNLAKSANVTNDATDQQAKISELSFCCGLLGLHLTYDKTQRTISADSIKLLVAEREEARSTKNWTLADKIRNQLLEHGIIIEDMPNGSTRIIES